MENKDKALAITVWFNEAPENTLEAKLGLLKPSVTKIEGPFTENGTLVQKMVPNIPYIFKATEFSPPNPSEKPINCIGFYVSVNGGKVEKLPTDNKQLFEEGKKVCYKYTLTKSSVDIVLYASCNKAEDEAKLDVSANGGIIIRGSAEFRGEAFKQLQLLTNDKLSMDETGAVTITEKGGANGDKSLEYGTNLVEELINGGTWRNNSFRIVDNTDGKSYVDPETGKHKAGNRFVADDKEYSLMQSEKGLNNEIGSGGVIYFDLNSGERGGIDINGSRKRDLFIALGHELIHGQNANKGSMLSGEDGLAKDPENNQEQLTSEEYSTRQKENILRTEHNMPLRILPIIKD